MLAIHNWNNAPVGFFHHFHQRWTGNICDSLNDGRLPSGFYAPVAIGDHLPEMPVFVDAENYVPLPLEVSYATTWLGCPVEFREAIESGRQ